MTGQAWKQVLMYMLLLFVGYSSALLELQESVDWKFHRNLYDYTTYGAITLEKIDIPAHAVLVNLSSSVESSSSSCPLLHIKIFANQFGFPVVSRDKEVFPNKVFVSNISVLNVSVPSNNQTVTWKMDHIQEGLLFLLAVMPPPDSRIKQQGLQQDCDYFMNTRVIVLHYQDKDIPQLGSAEKTHLVNVSSKSQTILSFHVAMDTQSYSVEVHGCNIRKCSVSVSLWETLDINMNKNGIDKCRWISGSCRLQVTSPAVNRLNYLSFSAVVNISLIVKIVMTTCNKNYNLSNLHLATQTYKTPFTCILARSLGRETPRQQSDSSDFNDHFVTWNKTDSPHSVINLQTLDTAVVVTKFALHTSDTGSSLKVSLHLPEEKVSLHLSAEKTDSLTQIFLCLSAHRLHQPMQCLSGAVLNVSSLKDNNKDEIIVPYPQAGTWFISLQSQCFYINPNNSMKLPIPCKSPTIANVTVHLAPCVDGGCGQYGTCKLYMESDLLYSACNCYAGWRGYGCNDGSQAASDAQELWAVYLLTLSNLGFIPAICLAVHRKFYVEALVYLYNMFFSTFYHACDTSGVHQLCIIPYNALSFADFFASLLSFWVTLMIMARIPQGLRSFLHMLSALFISLGEVYNRHGLLEQLLPIAGGVIITTVSWIMESYKHKEMFPSKKRLLKFILPGVMLSCLGLTLNLAMQTKENYKYVHSLWHLSISICIVFLLPPGKGKSGRSGNLSIQSGDITRQLFPGNHEFQAHIQQADDTVVAVQSTGTVSAPLTPRPSTSRERSLKLQNRASRQSFSV